MSQLDLSYYLRNVLEMTGCFNSACSAIIREKWMLCKLPILGYPLLDGRQSAPV